MTNDASCQTNFQRKIGRPRYYEADHLISALNKHMQSLEKRLEGKQINIENLLQSIQNCSYNNIVANSNHEVDEVSFENLNSPHEKTKLISNKSNQVNEDNNQNNNDNQKIISETNKKQYMTLDKRMMKVIQLILVIKLPNRKQKSS